MKAIKNLILAAIITAGFNKAQAQITVGQSDLALPGDSIFYAYDTNNVASNLSSTGGANKTWDFTAAKKNEVRLTNFLDPSASPIPAPADITHVLIDGIAQNISFLNVNERGFFTIVPNPAAPIFGGDPFFTLKTLSFPLNYQNVTRDSNTTRTVIPADAIGLGTIADSVRITITVKMANTCDGWGVLKTPTADYNSLRIKNVITRQFRFEGKSNLLGIWVPIPTSSLPIPIPANQVETSYLWVGQNSKYFLADASMVTDQTTTLEEFRYQIPRPVNTGLLAKDIINAKPQLYPNPANHQTNLWFVAAAKENYSIKIYDIQGRLIRTETLEANAGENQFNINTQELTTGIYHVAIIGGNNSTLLKMSITK
ncbi:MAG: T9SS type A sorting domain-containing protein [Bacteroidota bacterium]|jgi:hypothetical protein